MKGLSFLLIGISIFEIINMKKGQLKREIFIFIFLIIIAFVSGYLYTIKSYQSSFANLIFTLIDSLR